MEEEILYQFARNQDEKVQFRLRDYKDKRYIDLRVFFKPKDQDELLPTKKGITLAVEFLPEIKKGISACERKVLQKV